MIYAEPVVAKFHPLVRLAIIVGGASGFWGIAIAALHFA